MPRTLTPEADRFQGGWLRGASPIEAAAGRKTVAMGSLAEAFGPSGDSSDRPSRALVVEDQAMILNVIADALSQEGYEVTTAQNGAQAAELLEREPFDIILTDMVTPRLNGIDVIRAVKRTKPGSPLVVITGW